MAKAVIGPERPTLAEQVIGLFRLPYAVGCGLLAVMIASSVALLVLRPYVSPPNLVWLAFALWFLFSFYAFYAPHYIRGRLLQTERSIIELLPNGEQDFHKYFGRISAITSQLLLSVIIALTTFYPFFQFELYPIVVAVYPVLSVGIGSGLWAFYSSLRGIHKVGGSPLSLRPFYEDRALGLKPLGSLALSLTAAYFAWIGLAMGFLMFYSDVPTYLGYGGLIIFGLAMFFLPLRRLHLQMLQRKKLERGKLRERFIELFGKSANESDSPEDLGRLFKLEMLEKRVESIATWPYDMQILGKLSVITLSITAVLLARIIAAYLKIVVPLG